MQESCLFYLLFLLFSVAENPTLDSALDYGSGGRTTSGLPSLSAGAPSILNT